MILLLQEDCGGAVPITLLLVAHREHQGVTAILVGSLSVLIFNCELQELLVVVPLVSCVYVQLLSNACPLVMLGLRALHVVVDNMLEFVFLESGLVLRQLSSLISHFDILERSLAI